MVILVAKITIKGKKTVIQLKELMSPIRQLLPKGLELKYPSHDGGQHWICIRKKTLIPFADDWFGYMTIEWDVDKFNIKVNVDTPANRRLAEQIKELIENMEATLKA